MPNSNSTRQATFNSVEGAIFYKNYIAFATAEKGHAIPSLDWTAYSNTAQATTPDVNPPSAATQVTWTTSSSSPLSGSQSFLFTKAAANAQGQGVYIPVTIDAKDQGKVLQIEFDLSLVSGTFAGSNTPATDSDVVVYAADTTNSLKIQPQGRLLDSMVTGQFYKYRGTFQTSINSTAYNFYLHCATTSALAYTLKFDNFRLSSQVIPNGAAVTDWTSYTPTGSWTTNTTYNSGKWRRIGDNIEVEVKLTTSGAPTATGLTINLPSGITLDTSKNLGGYTGQAYIEDGGVQGYIGWTGYNGSSTTAFAVFAEGTGGTFGVPSQVTNTVPFTWGSTDYLVANFRYPVVGWSSNVQMSADTDTRVVEAEYSGTPTGTLSSALNAVTFPTKISDSHGAYSGSTFTTPVSGFYDISAQFGVSGTAANNGFVICSVKVNGTEKLRGRTVTTSVMTPVWASLNIKAIQLNAGDTVVINSATDITTPVFDTTASQNYFTIARVSGPSQIAASEQVNARYKTAAGQSIANSGDVIVNFDTKDYDTHNAVTTGASWKFTVPTTGKYRMTYTLLFTSAAYAANNSIDGRLYKNGSIFSIMSAKEIQTAFTDFMNIAGSDVVSCIAGDTIDFRIRNNRTAGATALHTDGAYCHLAIEKID